MTYEAPEDSKRIQILENIQSELRDIRKENGFWFDVPRNSVVFELKTFNEIMEEELPFVQIFLPRETDDTVRMPHKDEGTLDILVDCFVNNDGCEAWLAAERIIQDVRKKVQEDKSRGGVAKWTRIVDVIQENGADFGYEGWREVVLTVRVKYLFPWTEP